MELREKVARGLCKCAYSSVELEVDPYKPDEDYWLAQADAAIAMCMKEAAKVVEENAASLDYPSVYMGGPSRMAKMKVAGIAAAIRALIPSEVK